MSAIGYSAGGAGLDALGALGGLGGGTTAAFPWAALAMSLGPMALGPLLSGFDPAGRREQALRNIMSTGNYERIRQLMLTNLLNSSGYAAASRGIQAGAAASQNSMRSGLAAAGLSGSGIGAIAPGLASQAFAMNRGRLAASAEDLAGQRAGQFQQAQAASLGGAPLPPNYFANLLGAGFNAFGPIMGAWAQKRYSLPSWNTR